MVVEGAHEFLNIRNEFMATATLTPSTPVDKFNTTGLITFSEPISVTANALEVADGMNILPSSHYQVINGTTLSFTYDNAE